MCKYCLIFSKPHKREMTLWCLTPGLFETKVDLRPQPEEHPAIEFMYMSQPVANKSPTNSTFINWKWLFDASHQALLKPTSAWDPSPKNPAIEFIYIPQPVANKSQISSKLKYAVYTYWGTKCPALFFIIQNDDHNVFPTYLQHCIHPI